MSLQPIDILAPLAAGGVAAACIIPINIVGLAVWLTFAIRRQRRHPGSLMIQCTVIAAVLAAAALAPTKTVDRLLDGKVTLDRTEMTLQNLDAYAAAPENRDCFPIRMHLTFAEEDKDKTVRWASTQMTLSEFLEALESQTRLRRRFAHCGNSWTLLWGGDCCFGLSVEDSELVGASPYPRKRYERSW